jgi:pre-mRNA-processing factor 6
MKTVTKDRPLIVCTVARVLGADRAIQRAGDWFAGATSTDPDLGVGLIALTP